MIWLTWRQHRAQAVYFLVALAIRAAVLVPLGLSMFRALTDLGLDGCHHGTANVGSDCDTGRNTFSERFSLPLQFSTLLLLVPLLVGLFCGARSSRANWSRRRTVWCGCRA
jgi:hypothetical protein